MRKFVTNFARISTPISKMLKKGEEVKWDSEHSKAFEEIKEVVKNACVLRTLDYKKPINIFFLLPSTFLLQFSCRRMRMGLNNQLPSLVNPSR